MGVTGRKLHCSSFIVLCFLSGIGTLLPRSARLRSGSSPVKANAAPEAAAESWAKGNAGRIVPASSTDRPPEARVGLMSGCRQGHHSSQCSLAPGQVRAPWCLWLLVPLCGHLGSGSSCQLQREGMIQVQGRRVTWAMPPFPTPWQDPVRTSVLFPHGTVQSPTPHSTPHTQTPMIQTTAPLSHQQHLHSPLEAALSCWWCRM